MILLLTFKNYVLKVYTFLFTKNTLSSIVIVCAFTFWIRPSTSRYIIRYAEDALPISLPSLSFRSLDPVSRMRPNIKIWAYLSTATNLLTQRLSLSLYWSFNSSPPSLPLVHAREEEKARALIMISIVTEAHKDARGWRGWPCKTKLPFITRARNVFELVLMYRFATFV